MTEHTPEHEHKHFVSVRFDNGQHAIVEEASVPLYNAATDLLEACEAALYMWQSDYLPATIQARTKQQLRAAIAKAKGESGG